MNRLFEIYCKKYIRLHAKDDMKRTVLRDFPTMSFKNQKHLSLNNPFEQKIYFFIFNQSYFYLQEQTAPIVVANLNDSQGRKKNFDLRINFF
jgi:hypothetical protein